MSYHAFFVNEILIAQNAKCNCAGILLLDVCCTQNTTEINSGIYFTSFLSLRILKKILSQRRETYFRIYYDGTAG